MLTDLPKSKDIMENLMGFPTSFELPIIKDLTKQLKINNINSIYLKTGVL